MAQPGDIVELVIDDVAFGGAGVGHIDGLAVFVPFAIEGERVKARVTTVKKRFAVSELVSVETTSTDRVKPVCPWFGRCGGCQYQHIAYPRQLEIKRRQLSNALQRIGGVGEDMGIAAMPAAPRHYGYRNKITLHGIEPRGYVATDNRTILPIESCPLASDPINERLRSLARNIPGSGDVVLRSDGKGNVRVFRDGGPPQGTIEECIAGKSLRVPVQGFFQVNVPVAEQMLEWTAQALSRVSCTDVADAYCGAGLFSLLLADKVARVAGIEQHGTAVCAARANARALGLSNCVFRKGPVERELRGVLGTMDAQKTCVLLDPPRAGCREAVLETIGQCLPRVVIYISCNPPVLARDIRRLAQWGYRVQEAVPFDMFPQTAAFEAAALLDIPG